MWSVKVKYLAAIYLPPVALNLKNRTTVAQPYHSSNHHGKTVINVQIHPQTTEDVMAERAIRYVVREGVSE